MKHNLEAIVAVYSNWGIGYRGVQPIVIPEDRRHFSRITGHHAIIAGRKTLADFPGGRPLKGRTNYILSRSNIEIEGAVVVHSVPEVLRAALDLDSVFVVGGGSVYEALLPYTARVHVTKIDRSPESDTFFPNLDELQGWRLAVAGEEMSQNGVGYRFCVYERTD